MFNYKELEKWLNKVGKSILTWERDEDFNYVTDGIALVKFPRNDVLINQDHELYRSYIQEEKEKLLKCEKVLFYHFMRPPYEGQVLKKEASTVQLGIDGLSLKSRILSDSAEPITETGLFEQQVNSYSIFFFRGKYLYYRSDRLEIVDKSISDTFYVREDNSIQYADNHMIFILMPYKVKSPNKYLRLRMEAVK